MVIRELISDFNLNPELISKLALFIPMIGIPFLIVSWFMFIKFGFSLVNRRVSKGLTYSFFPILVVVPVVIVLLIHSEKLRTPANPDLFIIRILLILNLLVHLLFFTPIFLNGNKKQKSESAVFEKKHFLFYLLGVIVYSAVLNFYSFFGYLSTCIAIIFLFAVNILIPVFLNFSLKENPVQPEKENIDFKTFCDFYEISKREAEIVLEICTGKTNKAISEKLFITLQTVKDHTHRIYTKTGVKSRVQLANLVREKTGA